MEQGVLRFTILHDVVFMLQVWTAFLLRMIVVARTGTLGLSDNLILNDVDLEEILTVISCRTRWACVTIFGVT